MRHDEAGWPVRLSYSEASQSSDGTKSIRIFGFNQEGPEILALTLFGLCLPPHGAATGRHLGWQATGPGRPSPGRDLELSGSSEIARANLQGFKRRTNGGCVDGGLIGAGFHAQSATALPITQIGDGAAMGQLCLGGQIDNFEHSR